MRVLFDSSQDCVQMTLTGCGHHEEECLCVCVCVLVVVDAGQNSCLRSSKANCECLVYMYRHLRPAAEEQQSHTNQRYWKRNQLSIHKTQESTWRMSMFAQKEKEREKDILKYTFIQSLCEIKQHNWSALPSTLALLPPCNSPTHQVLTFHICHRHDDYMLSPILRPKPWLLWDRVYLTALRNDVFRAEHREAAHALTPQLDSLFLQYQDSSWRSTLRSQKSEGDNEVML